MRERRTRRADTAFVESVSRVCVRFHVVDALGVVWHGHYFTYFEDGRVAFGREHRFDYLDIYDAGFVAPIVHVDIDYSGPAKYGDTLTIRARLYHEDGAQVRFGYFIEDSSGRLLASGSTTQVFLDLSGNLMVTRPRFFDEFLERCRPLMRQP